MNHLGLGNPGSLVMGTVKYWLAVTRSASCPMPILVLVALGRF